MARMYSRKRGKSGSKKPKKKKHDWVMYSKEEIEKLIIKLAKEGYQSSQIGMILRDQYGIPDVREFGLRITKVMKRHNLLKEIPEDMFNLMKKAIALRRHLETNKKDGISKRGLILTESKIRRLGKYYVRKGRLPKDWKYSPEKAKLLVK
ncbi:MAG: 30S ribosomal protein S15 [Candidatus Latescibacterota bacterium]|nr:30S ribosomal protein S15 [Candidatus Aenigmarchaeota archaeon]RKY63032.1 MAG: 30S ribosomal protein S15 [Candidatus Latescibacterota bacterium]RLI97575.1 MAG: 30S ribosomal protein S15 [Candidatus Aenigmarchaeota archaeon]